MTKPRRTREQRLFDLTMKHLAGMAELTQHQVAPLIIATHASPMEIRILRADIKKATKLLDKVVALRSRRPR
jgi:hypothetical protein